MLGPEGVGVTEMFETILFVYKSRLLSIRAQYSTVPENVVTCVLVGGLLQLWPEPVAAGHRFESAQSTVWGAGASLSASDTGGPSG